MSMTLDHSQAPVPGDFAIRDLAVLAYAQGFTLWHYRADAGRLNLAAEAGFFDAAVDLVWGHRDGLLASRCAPTRDHTGRGWCDDGFSPLILPSLMIWHCADGGSPFGPEPRPSQRVTVLGSTVTTSVLHARRGQGQGIHFA